MPHLARLAFFALLLAACLLAGCAERSPAWVDEGASYTTSDARALLDHVDSSKLAETPTSAAPSLRQDALVSLRDRGPAAAQAANLLTRTFPADTSAVPVYIETATVDGRKALVVVEAWGPKGESLSLERMWVLDAKTGDVMDSAAVR